MPRTRAPYPVEFREEMVRLVRAGRSPGELSREFEPSEQTIRNWVNQPMWITVTAMGLLVPSSLSCGTCVGRTGSCERRRRSWQKQRPGSPSRVRIDTQAAFGFVKANQAPYPVRRMCDLLGVLG